MWIVSLDWKADIRDEHLVGDVREGGAYVVGWNAMCNDFEIHATT